MRVLTKECLWKEKPHQYTRTTKADILACTPRAAHALLNSFCWNTALNAKVNKNVCNHKGEIE